MKAEVWIAISQQARDTLRPLLADEEYDGVHLQAVRIFRRIINIDGLERLFRTPTLQGKVWHAYSIPVNDDQPNVQQRAADAIAYLDANYPNNFQVLGAWWWDGRQIGTQWVDEEDHSQGTTGTPLYPIPAQLLQFMPQVWDSTDPENPVPVDPVDLAQVRIIQGQSERRFT